MARLRPHRVTTAHSPPVTVRVWGCDPHRCVNPHSPRVDGQVWRYDLRAAGVPTDPAPATGVSARIMPSKHPPSGPNALHPQALGCDNNGNGATMSNIVRTRGWE